MRDMLLPPFPWEQQLGQGTQSLTFIRHKTGSSNQVPFEVHQSTSHDPKTPTAPKCPRCNEASNKHKQ